MPSSLHQGVVSIFRDDPELGFDLLRWVFGIELPRLSQITDRSAELDRFVPCHGDTGELRADLALSAHPSSSTGDRTMNFEGAALVIEVQRQVSRTKRFRMWVYQALLAERLELPTALLLVPLNDAVSRWSRALGQTELPPREALLVLDRQNMPRIRSREQARQRPGLAVLAALIHAATPDLECLRVGLEVALELPDSRRWRYASSILSTLSNQDRHIVLGALDMNDKHQLTELELNSVAYHDGLLEGKLEGLVRLVLATLELRGLAVDAPSEAKVRTCEQVEVLERWVERAARIHHVQALFE